MSSDNILNFPISRMPRWWRRGYTIALIVLMSALLHAWTVWQLPLDYDEPVYLQAAWNYAEAIKAGDLARIVNYSANQEHPPLVKLLYSLTFFVGEPSLSFPPELYSSRIVSAIFGVLAVWLIANINPTAGFLFALHSFALKYTSQAYLEALPLLMATGAVLAAAQALRAEDGQVSRRWWYLSAAALGITAASKYTYLLVLAPILHLMIAGRRRLNWQMVFLYGLVVLGVFWALNPYLWRDPISRLYDSLTFHASYTQSVDVAREAYPWYQPLIWVSSSVPWHPGVFFFFTLDEVIFWVGTVGIFLEGRRPYLVTWYLVGLAALLLWPTKWPQYSLVVIPPLALLAGGTLRWAVRWAVEQNQYWDYMGELLPQPPKAFWVLLAVVALALGTGKVVYEYEKALYRRGWTSIIPEGAPLPGRSVYDLQVTRSGRMAVATERGLALWSALAKVPWEADTVIYTAGNSGLPDNHVYAVLEDASGGLWLGTNRGLSYVRGEVWTTYRAEDLGLAGAHVRALAEDSQGRVWVGTLSGASRWDGTAWQPQSSEEAGLDGSPVFAIAVQPAAEGERVWFGTLRGIAGLNLSTGEWTVEHINQRTAGWDGVADLMVDSEGTLWAATIGAGLGRWDGQGWTFYHLGNSEIPSNFVRRVEEVRPGVLWLGFDYGTQPGGFLASFDGQNWRQYTPNNSGYTGGEPLALEVDLLGRIWIGTATSGLQTYEAPEG